MQTILGAGGSIGTRLVAELAQKGERVRLVGRNPAPLAGAHEVIRADVADLDRTVQAVAGSRVVYLLVGLKYDTGTWREFWPRIMENAIEACKRANAKLVFFDNVYMLYGKVGGPMTEQTPFNPCSAKGEVRARIANMVLDEIKAGGLTALIARSADFYGPEAKNSVANILVFDKFARRRSAAWIANDAVPHSFSYTPDAAHSLALLAHSESAWNQTWHVPTAADPPTGKAFVGMAAQAFGVEAKYRVLGRALLKLAGWFNSDVRESYEMLYQSDSAYLFDASKFARAFAFEPTSYAAGIRQTAAAYAARRA